MKERKRKQFRLIRKIRSNFRLRKNVIHFIDAV